VICYALRINPYIIQRAYFNSSTLNRDLRMRIIVSLNNITTNKVDTKNFWAHNYYDPIDGTVKGYCVSRIAQEISIVNGKTFHLKENEPIHVSNSQRMSE